MRAIAVLFLVPLLFVSSVLAEDVREEVADNAGPRFVPARFTNGLDAAAGEISFPDYKKDLSLFINCAAQVSAEGKVEQYFCLDYQGGTDTKFRRVTKRFIETTSISPAVVDGEPVPVEFYFRVFFGRQGKLYAVGVFPNWGDDAGKYGAEYEAPQRYNQEPPGPVCGAVGGISKVRVNEDGEADGDVDLVMSYGIPEHYSTCENWFIQTVSEGSYIPALHDGKTVAATYVELGGDPEWFTLKPPDAM
jgi:hypothetical protein